jgi:hypothetical protein
MRVLTVDCFSISELNAVIPLTVFRQELGALADFTLDVEIRNATAEGIQVMELTM